jgi:hypothetical protein
VQIWSKIRSRSRYKIKVWCLPFSDGHVNSTCCLELEGQQQSSAYFMRKEKKIGMALEPADALRHSRIAPIWLALGNQTVVVLASYIQTADGLVTIRLEIDSPQNGQQRHFPEYSNCITH